MRKAFVILFAVLAAAIFIGQVLAYAPVYRSGSDAWLADEGGIGYSVDSNTSSQYSAVLLDNNDLYEIERILIYYDPEYFAHHTNKYLEDKVSLIRSELILRNSPGVTVVDASETRDAILSEIESGTYRTALLMVTGAFPDTIYNGTADSPIVDWLGGGGVLYWIGDPIGQYISQKDDNVLERHPGYGSIFFGLPDSVVAPGEIRYAEDRSEGSDIASSLNIFYNIRSFGLDSSMLGQCLSIGYTDGGYDSIVLTKFHSGSGMMVILGGDASSDVAPVIAQIICSKINYSSSLVHHEEGSVHMGTASGRFSDTLGATDLYIYLGTPLAIYAKAFSIGKL